MSWRSWGGTGGGRGGKAASAEPAPTLCVGECCGWQIWLEQRQSRPRLTAQATRVVDERIGGEVGGERRRRPERGGRVPHILHDGRQHLDHGADEERLDGVDELHPDVAAQAELHLARVHPQLGARAHVDREWNRTGHLRHQARIQLGAAHHQPTGPHRFEVRERGLLGVQPLDRAVE
eukprot:scaffold9562_cov98-Isochrysis_galbana.AAC.4